MKCRDVKIDRFVKLLSESLKCCLKIKIQVVRSIIYILRSWLFDSSESWLFDSFIQFSLLWRFVSIFCVSDANNVDFSIFFLAFDVDFVIRVYLKIVISFFDSISIRVLSIIFQTKKMYRDFSRFRSRQWQCACKN